MVLQLVEAPAHVPVVADHTSAVLPGRQLGVLLPAVLCAVPTQQRIRCRHVPVRDDDVGCQPLAGRQGDALDGAAAAVYRRHLGAESEARAAGCGRAQQPADHLFASATRSAAASEHYTSYTGLHRLRKALVSGATSQAAASGPAEASSGRPRTLPKPPRGYQTPSVSSVPASREYTPGAL